MIISQNLCFIRDINCYFNSLFSCMFSQNINTCVNFFLKVEFYRNEIHPEKSLWGFFLNANKKGITLNLDSKDGIEIFKKLVAWADVLVESFTTTNLGPTEASTATVRGADAVSMKYSDGTIMNTSNAMRVSSETTVLDTVWQVG